jgi:hypothetical protein
VSTRRASWAWIVRRRGNRVGPLDASDLAAFRAIGAILIVVSLVVGGYYALNFDFGAFTSFRRPLQTARGTVTAVERTGSHEPGTKWSRRDDRTEIVAVQYSYVDQDRVERRGTSYETRVRLKPGDPVTVEHPVGQPEVARIRGFRTAKYDTMPWALGIIAGVGLALVGFGVLWRCGRAAPGCDRGSAAR